MTAMFQELLLADLVLADLSIDNANTFYQLGIRHAFRKRGIVHIQAARSYMPFDIFNVRTFQYHITPEGAPDPEFLSSDIPAIARLARDTWASDRDTIHSPIYNLLGALEEPNRKSLRTPLATGFWREYNEWKMRVTVAQRQKKIGDILLLTEEIRNPLIMEEAIAEAGQALANTGHYELALAQYRRGLELNPLKLSFRREEALHLNRLGRRDEATQKLETILAENPNDSEASAYLARIYKETWSNSWKGVEDTEKRLRSAFDASHWLLKAYQTYLGTFLTDLSNYYIGANAMILGSILSHLAERYDDPDDPDPEIREVREKLPDLRGALELILEAKADDEQADYWALITLAELRILTSKSPSQVSRAYRKAVAVSRENVFYIQSSINQLEVFHSLQLRPEFVQAGMDALAEEYSRITKEEYSAANTQKQISQKPSGQVFLFTGYMVDKTRQNPSRFPIERESQLRETIQSVLEKYNAKQEDMAMTAGLAAGSEILFAECCVVLRIPVQVHLPIPEAEYIRNFVSPSGEEWVERFNKLRGHPLISERFQADSLGMPRENDNVYERNNRWALYSSIGNGIDKTCLIAFWDGKEKGEKQRDAQLVNHMVHLMRDTGGRVEQINPMKVFRY
jgi:tetratricopeptide (TPR) repeat protein